VDSALDCGARAIGSVRRKPDGTLRICYDYWGLHAISRPAVDPLTQIDALLDGTKLDPGSSYHQLLVRAADRWKTSCRSQLVQFEWNVAPFGRARTGSP
jgi:hypothetical protein